MAKPRDIGADDTDLGLESTSSDDNNQTAVRPQAGIRPAGTDATALAGEDLRDSDSAPAPARGAESVRTGAVIGGRYRIVEAIARGSMSRVYRAEHMSIRRPVALKVIGAELARDGQAVSRFRQEAAVLANIAHPNVVAVYDIGTTAAGEPYIVMELVRGHSLAEVIKAHGRLNASRTLGLLLQITRALATVHEAGVIHRDMKPGNVLLAQRRGGPEVAKLVDFGLAKVVQDRGGGEFLTRTGTILGTPEYMSPEQIRGGAVDHRADIYSLGCMAYEMLTGAPPFLGEEMSTLYRHLHEKVRRMSEVCPDAGVAEPLQKLVDRAMAKEAADRFESAQALYRELLAVADQLGIPRQDLHLLDSWLAGSVDATLFAATVGDAGRRASGTHPVAAPRRTRRMELGLVGLTLAVAGVIGGVVFERSRGGGDGPAAAVAPEAAPAAAAPGPELLLLNTHPPGAQVQIDDQRLPETTPTAVRGLAPGPHKLHIRLGQYKVVERQLDLAPGEREVIDIRLEPPTRDLVVRAVPADARVFLDGRLVSPFTPATVTLGLEDFYEIRFEKDGYEPRVVALTPDDREPMLEVALEADRLPFGNLWIESRDSAAVWIDGQDSGYLTPTLGLRLPAGRHTVELRDSTGRRSGKARIDLAQGENIHLTLDVARQGDP